MFPLCMAALAGCLDDEDSRSNPAATPSTRVVGGSISNLGSAQSLILQNNSGDDLMLSANGNFQFSTSIADGNDYSVAIVTQPTRQTCSITNASGTISGANISDVAITCVTTAPIIFTTAATFTGDLVTAGAGANAIVSADALCMNDANNPGAGRFKALIVDGTNRVACTTADCSGGPTENIDWVLAANTAYRRSDGSTIIATTTANGIFSFPLTNSVTTPFVNYEWTGLSSDWTTSGDLCGLWTNSTISLGGRVGDPSATDSTTIDIGNPNCANTYQLYCVEQ